MGKKNSLWKEKSWIDIESKFKRTRSSNSREFIYQCFPRYGKDGCTMVVELKMAENIPLCYLELLVNSTDLGIEKPIVDKIFAPFFTTKERIRAQGWSCKSFMILFVIMVDV